MKRQDQLKAGRYIPKDATPIEEEGGVVYVYSSLIGDRKAFGALAYRGNARKAEWHYRFRTDKQLDERVEAFFESIRNHRHVVTERKADRKKPHIFKVNDIVTNSWGYDQTNVDWYAVTRTTKHFIWLRPIAATLEHSEGFSPMSGHESIALDENLKPIFLEKGLETKHAATGDYCHMKHGCGSRWTGDAKYSSWYA